jgi:hypothetical protein
MLRYRPARMFTALGLHSACLLFTLGASSMDEPAAASGPVLAVAQREGATCALRNDGVAVCWGQHPSFPAFAGVRGDWGGGFVIGQPTPGRHLPKLTAISLSEGHGWGITHEGNVVVWGPFPERLEEMTRWYDPWSDAASHELHKVAKGVDGEIVAVDAGACARRADGEVVCWPLDALDRGSYRLHDENDQPLPQGPLRALGSGDLAIGEGDRRCLVLASAQHEILDPRQGAEPSRTAPLRCDPPLLSIEEVGLARHRPCSLEAGRLRCQAPASLPSFETVQTWGHGDAFDPESGWFCSAQDERVTCATAAGDALEVSAPATVSALSMRGRRVWIGTDDGRISSFEPRPGGTDVAERGHIEGAVGLLDPSGGSQWCAVAKDGSLWWRTFSADAAERIKVRGRAVELACSHSTPYARVEPAGLFALELGVREVEGKRVLRPGRAVRVQGKTRVRGHAGLGNVWIDDRGGLWQVVMAESDRRLAPLERPEELRGLPMAAGSDVYSPSDVQPCLITDGGDVHCGRPKLRELDVSVGLADWRTKVDLPGPARSLVSAGPRTCAHLVDGSIHCWGPLRSELFEALRGAGPLVDVTKHVEAAR